MRAIQAEGWESLDVTASARELGAGESIAQRVTEVTEDREPTEAEGGCGGWGSHVMALSATP
jgi:hypothetical protein